MADMVGFDMADMVGLVKVLVSAQGCVAVFLVSVVYCTEVSLWLASKIYQESRNLLVSIINKSCRTTPDTLQP